MSPGAPHPALGRQGGIALILVLWALVFLTAIAAALTATQRTEVDLSRSLLERSQGRALAEAGIRYAVYMLYLEDPDRAWPADGEAQRVRFAGRTLAVAVHEDKGLIDLNRAPRGLLLRAFRGVGLEEAGAQALADAVADWKDPDDLRRLHGAEAAEYRAAGHGYGPANRPFRDLAELRLVHGVTPELYLRLRGLLTVDSPQDAVKLTAAPPRVRALFRGDLVDTGKGVERTAGRKVPVRGRAGFVGGITDALLGGLRVRVRVPLGGDRHYVAEATVVLDNRAAKGYYITKWHEAGVDFQATVAAGEAA